MNTRRDLLRLATGGIGALALHAMESQALGSPPGIDPIRPLMSRQPHFPPRYDRMIVLFQYGSPSQVDTFDYKPELQKRSGEQLPDSYLQKENIRKLLGYGFELMGSPFAWSQHGTNGLWISELFPKLAEHADDLCVIRSMVSDSNNHAPASLCMNTGALVEGKPSLGSWVTYGLGTENQDLPGFVVLYNVGPYSGAANFKSGFLPPSFGATHFRHRGTPIFDLLPPTQSIPHQKRTLELIQSLNQEHRARNPENAALDGRIASYEMAYRMQSSAMSIGDFSDETTATQQLYGLDRPETEEYGRMCLLARRLSESGVRVVQLFNGVANPKEGWDAHTRLVENHRFNALRTDQPIAGLLQDLKQRGLLDRTLVVWCGEFGRMPMWDSGSGRRRSDAGRNHNALGFSVWLAGGGVRGGTTIGATDELGLFAETNPFRVRDLHTTLLHGFGLNADDLTFPVSGRDERITGIADIARVIPNVFPGS